MALQMSQNLEGGTSFEFMLIKAFNVSVYIYFIFLIITHFEKIGFNYILNRSYRVYMRFGFIC